MAGGYPCECCPSDPPPGVCVYQQSNGNTYTDTFSGALDGGWNKDNFTSLTWSTSGGRLRALYDAPYAGAVSAYLTRHEGDQIWPPSSSVFMIIEANVWRLSTDVKATGIVVVPLGIIYARWDAGVYQGSGNFTDLGAGTPQDGDLVSMIFRTSGSGYEICFAINGIGKATFNNAFSPGNPVNIKHGLTGWANSVSSGLLLGEFDNYTSELNF